ncbi:hypothetical protein ACK3TF_001272 [Chlorella vulgaris]
MRNERASFTAAQVRALHRPAAWSQWPSTSPGLAARDEDIDDGGEPEPFHRRRDRFSARRVACGTLSLAADAHGEVKYNAWEKPTQIAQIVFLVLGSWIGGIYGATKIFGGKGEAPPAADAPATDAMTTQS